MAASKVRQGQAERAAELQALGYKAYRLGEYARARQLFGRALELTKAARGGLDPATGTAYSDLGAAAAALNDWEAARLSHEAALAIRRQALGDAHPDVAASLHNVGVVLRELGELAAAERCHREAVQIWRATFGPAHPAVARGLTSLGIIARLQGQHDEAVRFHTAALTLRELTLPPPVDDILASLGDLAADYAEEGNFAAVAMQWQRAVTLVRAQFGADSPRLAPLLNNYGIALRNLRDLPGAADTFAAALDIDADLPQARHNLAAVLTRLGQHQAARRHRDIALRRERFFIHPAVRPEVTVLILSRSDEGNVPLEHILPPHYVTRVWWFVEHVTHLGRERLPPYDIVFNGIGDPDLAAPGAATVAAFIRHCNKPVLNDPAKIALTRRDLLPALLGDIDGVVIPRTQRLGTQRLAGGVAVERQLADLNMHPPVLLRPAGSHGGVGVLRVNSWDEFDPLSLQGADQWYATHYVHCGSPDGFTRKYRIAFVGGTPYPYHLAISQHWMVHYFSADMERHAWKLAEEAAFLEDWRGAIGARAAAAITAIGQRLGLEFAGVDFAMLPDGRVLIFEANATMLIHPENPDGPLAHKNAAVGNIVGAMRRKLQQEKGRQGVLF